jgi:hypothetical protein
MHHRKVLFLHFALVRKKIVCLPLPTIAFVTFNLIGSPPTHRL